MINNNRADMNFDKARLKAFFREISAQIGNKSNDMLSFDLVRRELRAYNERYLGVRAVEIAKIVGSVDRYRDFDRAFLPKQQHTKERWKNIDRAYYEGVHLPAVQLYKVDDIYFVSDGNHRVSVAKEQGLEFIDAEVIECDTRTPITADMDIEELILKAAYTDFLEFTRLDVLRPAQRIDLSSPTGYETLKEHVATLRYFLSLGRGEEVSWDETVSSWYDRIYLPIVKVIEERKVLDSFPGRTAADLYLWVVEHRHYLSQQRGDIGAVEAAIDFAAHFRQRPLPKILADVGTRLVKSLVRIGESERGRPRELHLDGLDHSLEFNFHDGGEAVKEHIAVHRYYLGVERQAEVSWAEAVRSWHDHLYLPVVNIIRDRDILRRFPDCTEADLYLWISAHRSYLQKLREDEDVDVETAATDFAAQFGEKSLLETVGEAGTRVAQAITKPRSSQ